ncbi:hypothetical protein D3C76_443950 [compost metagenome]
MQRHQILVGRHDMLAAFQGFKNIFLRSCDPAHHFYYDVNLRVPDHFPGIIGDYSRIHLDITGFLSILHGNAFNENR